MTKNLIFLLIIVFTAEACCREKSKETAKYELSEEEKNFIPYEIGDSVKFVHSGGHEFYMNVTHNYTHFSRTETEHCGEDYITYEYKVIEMSSISPQLYCNMRIEPEEFNPGFNITFSGYQFIINRSLAPQLDSLNLGGNIYKNVFVAEGYMYDNTEIYPDKIYYNTQYGIIQINFSNNDSITIQK